MVSGSPRSMIPSRLLVCFRGDASLDPSSTTSDHTAPASCPSPAYFSTGSGKDGAAVPRILRAFSCRSAKAESTDARGGGRRRKRTTQNLRRIVKAVLFEAPLVKKIRNIKSRRSSSTISDKVERILEAMNEKPTPEVSSQELGVDQKVDDLCYPILRSPSDISTLSRFTETCQSKSNLCLQRNIRGHEDEERPTGVRRHCDSWFVLFLLLLIILVVICWGKICAIVCALMWLIVVPPCIPKLSESTSRGSDSVGAGIRGS